MYAEGDFHAAFYSDPKTDKPPENIERTQSPNLSAGHILDYNRTNYPNWR
jgi:hypothetical protein